MLNYSDSAQAAGYVNRITKGATGYPYGKPKGRTDNVAGTGTPFALPEQVDSWGWKQAVLVAAGATPNGVAESTTASQIVDAINTLAATASVSGLAGLLDRIVYPTTGDNAADGDTISTASNSLKFNGELYNIMTAAGVKTTASGVVADLTTTSVTIGGTAYVLWPASSKVLYTSMSDVMSNATRGYDGDQIMVARYSSSSPLSAVPLMLTRVVAADDSENAGTDWSTNGLIDNKFYVFGPNGEAYAYESLDIKLVHLGVVDGDAIDDILSNAITYSKNSYWQPIDIGVSTASLSSAMPQMNSSFDFVKVYSSLSGKSTITVTTVTDPVFVYSGGSGQIAGETMRNLKITKASGTGALFQFVGFCGAEPTDCYFSADRLVDYSNDIGSGTFTEFVRFIRCIIYIHEYIGTVTRGAGDDSFHGCGFVDCQINIGSSATAGFLIGDSGDTGRSLAYNWEIIGGSIFYNGSSSIYLFTRGNSYASLLTVKGSVSFELNNATVFWSDWGTGCAMDITSLGNAFEWGSGFPVSYVATNSNGTVSYVTKERMFRFLKPIGVSTFNIPNLGLQLYSNLFTLRLIARGNNFEYNQSYTVSNRVNTSTSGYVNLDAQAPATDVAGWGAPTLSYDATNHAIQCTYGTSDWTSVEIQFTVVVSTTIAESIRYPISEEVEEVS